MSFSAKDVRFLLSFWSAWSFMFRASCKLHNSAFRIPHLASLSKIQYIQTMFQRSAASLARKCLKPSSALSSKTLLSPMYGQSARTIGTLEESQTAKSAWEKSCYFEMDFTIPEEASVYEAVQKFAAYDVGCLVTTDSSGKVNTWISNEFRAFQCN